MLHARTVLYIAVWLVIVIEDIICGGGGGSSSNSLKCNTFTPPTGGVCVFVIAPMPPLFATPLPLPTAMPTTVAAVADLNVAYSPSSISPVALSRSPVVHYENEFGYLIATLRALEVLQHLYYPKITESMIRPLETCVMVL
uniref:Uncharacterized protein n=1 Tax=Glossina palpalis gambiensis TaxID=67801 RepID=A0A1B0C4P3_9MUSC